MFQSHFGSIDDEVRVIIPNMTSSGMSLINRKYTFWCLGHIIEVSSSNYDMALRVCHKVWQSKIDSSSPGLPLKPRVFLLATTDSNFPELPRRYQKPTGANVFILTYPLTRLSLRRVGS